MPEAQGPAQHSGAWDTARWVIFQGPVRCGRALSRGATPRRHDMAAPNLTWVADCICSSGGRASRRYVRLKHLNVITSYLLPSRQPYVRTGRPICRV